MRKESLLVKIWNCLWPLAIYMTAQSVVTIAGVFLVGSEPAIVFVLIAALICIPIYYKMYQEDCRTVKETKRNVPITNKDIAAIAVSGAALALAMNNIISLTPLPQLFPGYESTNEVIYGGGFLLQILTAGIFACIVEELSMRGIVYLRMKRYWGKKSAMILSALVFGLYHLNVVQAVYAFVLGLFFVWLYERYESLWASCIGHMSANLFILMLSGSSIFQKVITEMVGFCLVTCIALLVFYYGWNYMKQTKLLTEIQFVEKEPDTLERLREEYKEQEREEE